MVLEKPGKRGNFFPYFVTSLYAQQGFPGEV